MLAVSTKETVQCLPPSSTMGCLCCQKGALTLPSTPRSSGHPALPFLGPLITPVVVGWSDALNRSEPPGPSLLGVTAQVRLEPISRDNHSKQQFACFNWQMLSPCSRYLPVIVFPDCVTCRSVELCRDSSRGSEHAAVTSWKTEECSRQLCRVMCAK